jgi:pimeloyl-ACP methyl ester carboxylesterase
VGRRPARPGDGARPGRGLGNAVLPGRRVELGARAEDVSLVTGDGVALRGWYAPSRNGAAVVLVHGLGGDRTQLLRPAARLAGLGYGVLVFDLRGHGESGGRRTSLAGKERADVRAAVDFVASRSDVRPGRLAAVGYSIGGMAVELEAAADRRVSAVDLAGSFPSLSAMVHLHEPGPRGYVTLFTLRAVGVDDRDVRPEDSLCEVAPRPVLFVDGTADPAARDADRYEARACGPARVVLLPGAAHGDYGGAAEAPFTAVLARFLGETIGR